VLLWLLVRFPPIPSLTETLAVLTTVHLLSIRGCEVELPPEDTKDLIRGIRSGKTNVDETAAWIQARVATGGDDNLIDSYLAQLSKFPAPTPGEVRVLVSAIAAGRQARVMLESTSPGEHQTVLEHQVLAGDQARRRLLEANLHLVVTIAKRYETTLPGELQALARVRGQGSAQRPLLDLIQAGNLGLLRAVDQVQPDQPYEFATYATWWIRQAITDSLRSAS
jgi:DNA-directed RNA polymerase sigma subunit (sigma70/sigma32)